MLPLQKPEIVENVAVARILEAGTAMFGGEKYAELAVLLASMRGLAILHQTHHWQAYGPTSYSDHLLFERLYTETEEQIDGLAERLVGLNKGAMVSFSRHVVSLGTFLTAVKQHGSSDEAVRRSMDAEKLFLELTEAIMERLKASDLLTRGLEQHLGDIADTHESLIYLLKQRIG